MFLEIAVYPKTPVSPSLHMWKPEGGGCVSPFGICVEGWARLIACFNDKLSWEADYGAGYIYTHRLALSGFWYCSPDCLVSVHRAPHKCQGLSGLCPLIVYIAVEFAIVDRSNNLPLGMSGKGIRANLLLANITHTNRSMERSPTSQRGKGLRKKVRGVAGRWDFLVPIAGDHHHRIWMSQWLS